MGKDKLPLSKAETKILRELEKLHARARSTHGRLRVYQCPFCRDWHPTRAV